MRDIDTDQKKLRIKHSQGWRNAVQEMKKYKGILESGKESTETSTDRERTTPHGRKRKRKGADKEAGEGEGEESMEEEGEEVEERRGEGNYAIGFIQTWTLLHKKCEIKHEHKAKVPNARL